MNFIIKHKTGIISLLVIFVVIFSTFISFENPDNNKEIINNSKQTETLAKETEIISNDSVISKSPVLYENKDEILVLENTKPENTSPSNEEEKQKNSQPIIDDTKSKSLVTDSAPIAESETENLKSEEISDTNMTCTLSVRCDTILDNMSKLDTKKTDLIPQDGVIFYGENVTFSDGESVFDVILREFKNNGIHFEFVKTPGYNSVYIEGIANLYEFDCGDLSGWIYRVNGISPNYDSSQYILKKGDKIEFLYTCNLGLDI